MKFFENLNFSKLFSKKKIDDNLLDKFEELLIESDVGTEIASELKEKFKKEKIGKEIKDEKEIFELKDNCWIHCKNLDALTFFNKFGEIYNYFWHQNDKFTLTSKGYIWTYPGETLSFKSICVMPELNMNHTELTNLKNLKVQGICTDFPNLI